MLPRPFAAKAYTISLPSEENPAEASRNSPTPTGDGPCFHSPALRMLTEFAPMTYKVRSAGGERGSTHILRPPAVRSAERCQCPPQSLDA